MIQFDSCELCFETSAREYEGSSSSPASSIISWLCSYIVITEFVFRDLLPRNLFCFYSYVCVLGCLTNSLSREGFFYRRQTLFFIKISFFQTNKQTKNLKFQSTFLKKIFLFLSIEKAAQKQVREKEIRTHDNNSFSSEERREGAKARI